LVYNDEGRLYGTQRMCMIIPLISVVANAFIELRRKQENEDELLFEQMDAYRRGIIDLLAQKKKRLPRFPVLAKMSRNFLINTQICLK